MLWVQKTHQKEQKHNQPLAELQQQYSTAIKKEKADAMVELIDARSPEENKLMTANNILTFFQRGGRGGTRAQNQALFGCS
jgi:hypothetical protein